MCTVVILRRPGEDWPLILAANRDEMIDRPWRPPGRHWPDRADVVAGRDELAFGTWLGINDTGVVAAIMNREGSLGPDPDKRSRGELVLEALDHADAVTAAGALRFLEASAYRPFNLVVADNRDAYWLKSTGAGAIEAATLETGISMLTARDLNDTSSGRIAAFMPRFKKATAPVSAAGDWTQWEALMAAGTPKPGDDPHTAMALAPIKGYGTVSGSLLALPSSDLTALPGSDAMALPGNDGHGKPRWRFCAGRPGTAPYRDVTI
ncbi:MAG: NRDE family protein [Alphaproteobacteria bacterium]|nr:NRDE family protein [Alphaproteobacteria bacterium]